MCSLHLVIKDLTSTLINAKESSSSSPGKRQNHVCNFKVGQIELSQQPQQKTIFSPSITNVLPPPTRTRAFPQQNATFPPSPTYSYYPQQYVIFPPLSLLVKRNLPTLPSPSEMQSSHPPFPQQNAIFTPSPLLVECNHRTQFSHPRLPCQNVIFPPSLPLVDRNLPPPLPQQTAILNLRTVSLVDRILPSITNHTPSFDLVLY